MNPMDVLRYQGATAASGVYRAPIVGMAGALPFELGICSFDVQDLDTLRSVEQLDAYDQAVVGRIKEIDTEHAGLPLPTDLQSEWADLNATHESIGTRTTELKERAARIATLSGDPAAVETAGGGYAPRRPAATIRTPEDIFSLEGYRAVTRSDADYASALRSGAMRAVEIAPYNPGVDKAKAQAHLERLLTAEDQNVNRVAVAVRVLASGSPQYLKAFGKFAHMGGLAGLAMSDIQALSLGSDAGGGFMVPFSLDPTIILTSDGVINPLRRISRVEQITGKVWEGVTSAGITVTRKSESAEADDNSPTLAQPTATTSRVEAFVPFSRELDASINVAAAMAPLLADAKDTEEADSFVNGDGQGLNPHGIIGTLANGSFIPTVGAGGFGVEDVYSVKNGVPPRFRARGRYLGDTSIYDLVRQFSPDGGGGNLWVQLGAGTPGTLAGYPAEEISTMDATLAPGSHILAFGDFQQFLIVDRIGMSVDVIPHLFGANRRPTGQRGLFALWNNGTKILTDAAFRVLEVGS